MFTQHRSRYSFSICWPVYYLFTVAFLIYTHLKSGLIASEECVSLRHCPLRITVHTSRGICTQYLSTTIVIQRITRFKQLQNFIFIHNTWYELNMYYNLHLLHILHIC